LEISSHDFCNTAYGGNVTDEIIVCAYADGADACVGDGGGPLILQGNASLGISDTIVGIVSSGNGCAREGFPGKYTRVSAFIDWIQDTVCSLTQTPDAEKPGYCPQQPPSGICFSGDSEIQLENRPTPIHMRDLQIGDSVLVHTATPTTPNKYERVYSFAHRQERNQAQYLRFLPSGLEASATHLIFIEGRSSPIPASQVKVGDILMNRKEAVESIQLVSRKGVFSPLTPSGKMIVNGVMVSNYVALQEDEHNLRIGSFSTPFSYHTLEHLLQVPHRVWCHWMGMEDGGVRGVDGVSVWSIGPWKVFDWVMEQHAVVIGLVGVPTLLMLLVFGLFENVLVYPVGSFVLLFCSIGYYYVRSTKNKMKTKLL